MRLGILQPYFCPALGYFDLIASCDRWVVFDTAQYRRHSWMNRNRILHPDRGWQYLTVPVSRPHRGTPIKDVRLCTDRDWRTRLIAQLAHYRRRAPNYESVVGMMEEAISVESESLSRLNVAILTRICDELGLPFRREIFSEMDLEIGPVEGPGDWALRICEALGANEYVNPPRGESIFDRAAFEASGIRLVIRRFPDMTYAPKGHEFLPGLSVLDALMWCSRTEVRAHLDRCREVRRQ